MSVAADQNRIFINKAGHVFPIQSLVDQVRYDRVLLGFLQLHDFLEIVSLSRILTPTQHFLGDRAHAGYGTIQADGYHPVADALQ